ncbi:MAG: HAD hydrolase-like protein [Victivallales bacterium]|nr:HAD hydrolase-like protein [Victivallales bacterium]
MDYVGQLKQLPKKFDFFIGIDSDGCVFDTMEIKQKECFCPAVIKHMKVQSVSRMAREVWEFVNLYSKTRGCNRFLALQRFLRLLRERPEVAARGVNIPDYKVLDAWIERESKLGNPALQAEVEKTGDSELETLLAWSLEVNERIGDMVYGISPFPYVKEFLEQARVKADVIVVSQTPLEALEREWQENRIESYIEMIAGQEHGTKTEHIKYATEGKGYAPDKILMIGDAPGDLKAATGNKALFFPIIPGAEESSWKTLAGEGLERFFAGTFAGSYQQQLIEQFDRALPENPEW